MLRAEIIEEPRTTLARFQSNLNMEIRDKDELLSFNDLNDLVQLCERVEEQIQKENHL